MHNKASFILKLIVFYLISAFSISNFTSAEVVIVENATVYTSNKNQRTVSSFAYKNGKIIQVGEIDSIRKQYPNHQTINLEGKTVIPGLIDAHVHLLSLGMALSRVDLVDTKSKEDILGRLKKYAEFVPEEKWLLGRGWDQNDWPIKELPTAEDLDTLFPNRPVWLTRIDGHAGWANTAAMNYASKELSGDWQPDGGEIVRNSNQSPTGIFVDNAEALIAQHVPIETDKDIEFALTQAMAKTASVGLTSVHNAGTSKRAWDILNKINEKNALNVRYYAMADGNNEMLDHLCEKGPMLDDSAMLVARSVKLYSDGALGSRGAALLAPYSDRPDQSGLLLEYPEVLSQYAQKAASCGLQVNIHAIGDRGNRVSLDAIESTFASDNLGRHRIEHSQIIDQEDFERFKKLNIIASVQPTHATSDMYWAEDRVGPKRIKGAYAWQTFIGMGIPIALGSDFPVEKANPLLGFHAAVSRQDAKNWPTDGWYPEQALTRDQALHGFTIDAAFAGFQENEIGSIEVGKYADFIVLDNDIMTIPTSEILQTSVLSTFLNGKEIYKKDQ